MTSYRFSKLKKKKKKKIIKKKRSVFFCLFLFSSSFDLSLTLHSHFVRSLHKLCDKSYAIKAG